MPVDPARTTAKPVLRLIVPPDQTYTGELLVGVWAGALYNGSLIDNMGLTKVIAHYEGNTVEILAPSFQTFSDVNGNPVTYFGWWVRLSHSGAHGLARLYLEAVPKDATMQRRVIGPYQFRPAAVLHDLELTIAPSLSEIAGQRYQTWLSAINYVRATRFNNPRITFAEAGAYDITGGFTSGAQNYCTCYCTVEATAPVTLRRTGYTTDTAATVRPNFSGLHFKGANITFDWRYFGDFYDEQLNGHNMWLDGIMITNSGGREELWRKGMKPLGYLFRGNPWFTECTLEKVGTPFSSANLVRGCTTGEGFRDWCVDVRCAIDNRANGWDSGFLATDLPALTAQYTGAGASATLELSGGNDATSRTLTAKVDGASVGSFTIQNTEAAYTANTNYTVQNVVNWINGLSGWAATLLDNTRRASFLSVAGNNGAAFGATDAKTAPLTLVAMIDVHQDMYQENVGGLGENMVFAGNKGTGIVGQNVLLSASSPTPKDFIVINNAFTNVLTSAPYSGDAFFFTQFGYAQSHVVFAHNSWPTQGVLLRKDISYNPDTRCLVANNALRTMAWSGGTDTDLVISNNHLHAGSADASGATGTTMGGDSTNLFVNAVAGDFTPAGALLSNKKVPVVKYDLARAKRGTTAPAGAFK